MRTEAMIHSKKAIGEIDVIRKTGDNEFLVRTEDGILCKAIFNWFVGLYYADDIYRIVKDEKA